MMFPNPTTWEVDDFIKRQEEVERLRNQLYVTASPSSRRKAWNYWNPREEK